MMMDGDVTILQDAHSKRSYYYFFDFGSDHPVVLRWRVCFVHWPPLMMTKMMMIVGTPSSWSTLCLHATRRNQINDRWRILPLVEDWWISTLCLHATSVSAIKSLANFTVTIVDSWGLMNFLAGISETLGFSREFLRRYVSRGQILKSVFSGRCMAQILLSSTCNHWGGDRTIRAAGL